MLYYLIRPVARYVLSYYYRNIDLTGLEHIPDNAAVILAANHPTGFIEPCILACFQPRTLRFLARGSVFTHPVYNQLLAAVNILPVFRLEDGGYERLKENYDTFAACYRSLSRKQAIGIMAEGRCIHEKNLRPLRKGTARLALGALDRDPTLKEVYVVPVGINFTHAERARCTVMIRCGAAIRASEFLDAYRRGEATAIKNFTRHLRSRLSPLVVQFPDRDRAGIGEAMLEIDRGKYSEKEGITNDGEQLDRELRIAAATPDRAPELTAYCNRLDRQRVPPREFTAREHRGPAPAANGLRALLALLLQLPQFPLWLLAEAIAATKPKHIEFYSPVRFAVITGGTLLFYPLALLFLPWLGKAWLLLAIFTTSWSIRQVEKFRTWYQGRKVARMVAAERKVLREMLAAYEESSRNPAPAPIGTPVK